MQLTTLQWNIGGGKIKGITDDPTMKTLIQSMIWIILSGLYADLTRILLLCRSVIKARFILDQRRPKSSPTSSEWRTILMTRMIIRIWKQIINYPRQLFPNLN